MLPFIQRAVDRLQHCAFARRWRRVDHPPDEALTSGTTSQIDALGNDFEHASNGKIDFLLLSEKGFPLIVLEAKSSKHEPLTGKEQARKYARSQNCRFVILSNGDLHYFWDLDRGDPYQITAFPSPPSVQGYSKVIPNPQKLINESVNADFIALTQRANYASDAGWKNEAERPAYIEANKLRFLRDYQLKSLARPSYSPSARTTPPV